MVLLNFFFKRFFLELETQFVEFEFFENLTLQLDHLGKIEV